MILKEAYARFYKSFNYDFLRKNSETAEQKPWELVEGKWYPYVRVPIEEDITTIVGANESGKSHLITVIEKGITGNGINREDFCRYSHFYTVELGKRRWPDFGFRWTKLSEVERQVVAKTCSLEGSATFDQFYFFRENKNLIRIYIPVAKEFKIAELTLEQAKPIIDILPQPFRINSDTALPSSVPIALLADPNENGKLDEYSLFGRKNRVGILRALFANRDKFVNVATVQQSATTLVQDIGPFAYHSDNGTTLREAELKLARDLICKVARIDPDSLAELSRAIADAVSPLNPSSRVDCLNSLIIHPMALDPKDYEVIERLIYKNADDVAVSIARSFERLEERIDATESRLYSRLADLEDRIEASRQDISDELGNLRSEMREGKSD